MEKTFSIESYLQQQCSAAEQEDMNEMERFQSVCALVQQVFEQEWKETDDLAKNRKLEREKKAMMGYTEETEFYKEKIKDILRAKKLSDRWCPPWYPDLTEAIFAEVYGLSGLAPWAYDMEARYKSSSSAKLIGDRLYLLFDGKAVLQPQRIPARRREQLKRTLLMATPHERLERGFHEVYLRNGIRITIYSGNRTKPDQEIMVFRKYILKDLSFEALAEKGTIPSEAIPLFHHMIAIGANTLFAGQVRSGKTTFLQIWQSCEDPVLEGLALATDPETPWHKIMPNAPIMQLVADGKALEEMTKSLLRGDNDYLLIEEMRDGTAFRMALDMTSTGTKRCKGTIHEKDGINIPYKMATKIRERYGGDEQELIAQVYKNFDYVIELCLHPDNPSKKVMRGIWEYVYDMERNHVFCRRICKYDFQKGIWLWNREGGKEKIKKYPEEKIGYEKFHSCLSHLWECAPMENEEVYPSYYKENRHV